MTVRLFLFLVTVLAVAVPLRAQNAVRFTIQGDQVTGPISPMIYGTNVLCIHPLEAVDNTYPGIPARRFGGDRITGYNWENNFSNGGVYVCDPAHPNDPDYCNPNDDALPYFHNLPANEYRTPGAVLRAFHDRSVENGSFSLV